MRLSVVILDAGPVGMLGKAPGGPEAARCWGWLDGLLSAGRIVAIPEIARYEVRRELFRIGSSGGLARLDRIHSTLVILPITADVLDIASELWAEVRRAGRPTAPDESLDADAILAAQAIVAAGEWGGAVVATTNVGHLARFPGVDAREWWEVA